MSAEQGKYAHRGLLALVVVLVGLCAFLVNHAIRTERSPAAQAAPADNPKQASGVSCLGRIQPDGGMIHLAAPAILGRPPVVETLYAKEGDRIERGKVIAILA